MIGRTLADIEGRYVFVSPEEGVSLATLGVLPYSPVDADVWEDSRVPHVTVQPGSYEYSDPFDNASGFGADMRPFAAVPPSMPRMEAPGAGISFADIVRTINPNADPGVWRDDNRVAAWLPDHPSVPSNPSFADLVRTISPTVDPAVWNENDGAWMRTESPYMPPDAGPPLADPIRTEGSTADSVAWDRTVAESQRMAGQQQEFDRVAASRISRHEPRAYGAVLGANAITSRTADIPSFTDDAAQWRTDVVTQGGSGDAQRPVRTAASRIRPFGILPFLELREPEGRSGRGGGAGRLPPTGAGRPAQAVPPKVTSPTPSAQPSPVQPTPVLPTATAQPTANPAASSTQIVPSPSTSAHPSPRPSISATPPPPDRSATPQSPLVAPRLRELFAPDGKLIGRAGASSHVREIHPDVFGQKHSDLKAMGVSTSAPATYRRGYAVELPDGSIVGVRVSTKSGLTFDVLRTTDPLFPPGFKVHQNDK
jgi:hypothetical protein